MTREHSHLVLLADYQKSEQLAKAYLSSFRYHGVLFPVPVLLGPLQTVFMRFALPGGRSVTLSARVSRRYPGPVYALRLLPGPGTETLLGVARECTRMNPELLSESNEFREHRVEVSPADMEDTAQEIDFDESALTPLDEVLTEHAGRFTEWMDKQDLQMNAPPATDYNLGNGKQTVMLTPNKDRGGPEEIASAIEASRHYLLSQMSTDQKKRLAVSGGPAIRKGIMADPDDSLQTWVLRNPKLTEQEVIRYVRTVPLTDEAVRFLLVNPRWSFSPRIAKLLTLIPNVPPEALPNLLTVLPTDSLTELGQRRSIPDCVRSAVHQALLERSA